MKLKIWARLEEFILKYLEKEGHVTFVRQLKINSFNCNFVFNMLFPSIKSLSRAM